MNEDLILKATGDGRLRGLPLSAYAVLCSVLSTEEFRPVKMRWLAHRLLVNRDTASAVTHRLERLGYVERGQPVGRLMAFRLLSRGDGQRNGGKIPPSRAA